jgi:hypothetical protein
MIDDDELEPPVPPNLGTLEGPLSSVVDFLKLDPDLVDAAAETSEDVPTATIRWTPKRSNRHSGVDRILRQAHREPDQRAGPPFGSPGLAPSSGSGCGRSP